MHNQVALSVAMATAAMLSFASPVHAQTKYTVQVNQLDGVTAFANPVVLQAEDSDGNLLLITPSGGAAISPYPISSGGNFNNFTLQASPTGSKIGTLYFSTADVVLNGTTTAGGNTIIFGTAVPSKV